MDQLPKEYTDQWEDLDKDVIEVQPEELPAAESQGWHEPGTFPTMPPTPMPASPGNAGRVGDDDFWGTDDDSEDDDPLESMFATAEMDEEGKEEFANLVADGVGFAKESINLWFDSRFTAEVEKSFEPQDRELVSLVTALDQEDRLSLEALTEAAEKAKYNPSDVIRVKARYVSIKKRWQSSEYKEYMQNGIRKSARRVADKYMQNTSIDPIVMLLLYVAVALGGDVARIAMNLRKKPAQ